MYCSKLMMQKLYILSLCIKLIHSFGENESSAVLQKMLQDKKGVRVDRIEACGGSPNASFNWEEVVFENLSNGAFRVLYSKSTVTRQISKLRVSLEVQRCSSKESLDSCQFFLKTNAIDTCQLIEMKGVAWSGIVEGFEPRLKCPIKPAVYVSKESTFNPNLGFFFPLENWYWKIKARLVDGDEYGIVCLDLQAYTIRK